jgi:hypothetical protein
LSLDEASVNVHLSAAIAQGTEKGVLVGYEFEVCGIQKTLKLHLFVA